VRTLLDGAYAEFKLLLQYRDQLKLVASELLEHEALDTKTFRNLIEKKTGAA
jgi:ATP-dependent Zn protease